MINNGNILVLRKELDEIDRRLGGLLIKRFQICRKIGEHKKENGLAIEDLDREKQIIDNKIKEFNLPKEFVKELFLLIFKYSKKMQYGN